MFSFSRSPMIARLALLGAVCLVTAGAQSSCSVGDPSLLPGPGDDSGTGPTFTTTLVLRNSAGTETYQFSRGEIIHFALTVRNRTSQSATVQFNTGQQMDFVVFDNGSNTARWQWSEGRSFTQQVTEITFAPNESKTFTVDWNQETRSADTLSPGSYETRGVLPFEAFYTNPLATHELGSTLRAFTVN
jgi:hypothetical protein